VALEQLSRSNAIGLLLKPIKNNPPLAMIEEPDLFG
jgi:hypothetical protein